MLSRLCLNHVGKVPKLFTSGILKSVPNRTLIATSKTWIQKPALFTNVAKNIVLKQSLRETMSVSIARPKTSSLVNNLVGYWLLGCSGMVFIAVVLGGVTRLTESGLSMVTWKLLGESMPQTQEQWELEFARYQEFPEFKIKNSDMTLEQFKMIWWMEYAHRQWGRLIGAVFAIPAAAFWAKGYFQKPMKARVLVYGTLIGMQGLMGWYMVKSGLEDRFNGENDVPRVSQYRLAAHLSLAFVLYTALVWSALHHLLPPEKFGAQLTKAALKFKRLSLICKGMAFLTAVSGAFVAGLDAGLTYNSFPKMADKWVPDDILAMSPAVKNITENPTTVQFNHRILGTTTLALITGMWFMSRRTKLPRRAYIAASAVGIMAYVQVALGITTLLTYVPVHLGACHQSGSLLLLSAIFWLCHEMKYLKKIPK